MGKFKNNYNYTFFLKEIQIIHSISLNFLKIIYIYIYIYIYLYDLDSSVFSQKNSLVTNILKKINGHVVENRTPIEIQF